jgi:hypothetical protein
MSDVWKNREREDLYRMCETLISEKKSLIRALETIRPFLIPGDHKEGHLREIVDEALAHSSQDRTP